MASVAVERGAVRRDGTALAWAETNARSKKAVAAVRGTPLLSDRVELSVKAVADVEAKAKGIFDALMDRSRTVWSQATFWLGIGADEARDWVERKVVVPVAVWRGADERKLEFEDGAGKKAEASVEGVGVIGGNQTFEVAYGRNAFQVEVPVGMDADEVIKKVLNLLSQVPAHLRGPLKVVSVAQDHNPLDPYNEKKYGIDGFTSAATAGGGVITFWNGLSNLRKGTFDHEMGHLIGSAIHERDADALGDFLNIFEQMAAPHDWKDAIRTDGKAVSNYAKTNPDEDFAEHWEAYVEARKAGPKAVEEFRKAYPVRAKFLEAVYDGRKAH